MTDMERDSIGSVWWNGAHRGENADLLFGPFHSLVQPTLRDRLAEDRLSPKQPILRVSRALQTGAKGVIDLAVECGLSRSTVFVALGRLQSIGRVTRRQASGDSTSRRDGSLYAWVRES